MITYRARICGGDGGETRLHATTLAAAREEAIDWCLTCDWDLARKPLTVPVDLVVEGKIVDTIYVEIPSPT